MANEAAVMQKSGARAAVKPEILSLRTQLVSQGHTRILLAETDNCTFRIHCYGPKSGENGLHAHIDEDHIFVVLEGEAQFYDLDGALPVLKKHQALMLPKGCFYSFSNDGRRSAGACCASAPWRRTGRATASIRRASRSPAAAGAPVSKPTILIDNAFFE